MTQPRENPSGVSKGSFQPAKTGLEPHKTGLGMGMGMLKHASALGGDLVRNFGKVASWYPLCAASISLPGHQQLDN